MSKNRAKMLLAILLAVGLSFSGMDGVIGMDGMAAQAEAAGQKATVKLNKTKATVNKGQKVTLKIVKKNVKKIVSTKWTSKNKKIASVSSKGDVTGKAAGKSTTINCQVKYQAKGSKKVCTKKLKCTVTVKKAAPKPERPVGPNPPQPDGPFKPQEPQQPQSGALVPKPMAENQVQQNPYLSAEESMIHNDIYNSDVTQKAMPFGIYPEIVESVANDSPTAPPAFFYDNRGNAVAPYSQLMDNGSVLSGGIAIRDMDSSDLKVLGKFQPFLHDNGAKYGIQISYSFVDKENYLVGPTTHGHVIMVRTYDDAGNILPVFEKKLDVDVVSAAVGTLGEDIDKNLLSIAYDYAGNLWFVTGGFHKNPSYSKAGFAGYLEREYIDRALAGEDVTDAAAYIHCKKLAEGENAENGIAGHQEGCVVLTNKACHLFAAASSGVQEKWSSPYESSGGKGARPDKGITGAGLAWGGGSSPTLTDEMVLFTDNQDVVNLIALDIKTGKTLVKSPVLELGSDVVVSVENSICVYAPNDERASVLVCNWFGAGNAGLFEAGADSSVQSYDNIYDKNWREKGSACLMPGVERIDIVKQEDGSYKSEKVWVRKDLKDTSMIKLSTSAGYYYGYTQNEETAEWGFIVLDYGTGKTVMWQPVSAKKDYNNVAVGIMQGNNGNSIYCPTNSQTLVRLQDRFAYLPSQPDKKLDLVRMERHAMTKGEFQEASGSSRVPATYLMSAVIDGAAAGSQTLSFRVNGLTGSTLRYALYYRDRSGKLNEYKDAVFTDSKGRVIGCQEKLEEESIYEVRLEVEDAGRTDCGSEGGSIKATVILAVCDDAPAGEMADEELYAMAVKDATIAQEDEIRPLVSLTKKDPLVTWDSQGRVLLCTWHSYPDSYPKGEVVTAQWGYIWTFTDKELASHAKELKESKDAVMRLRQLISIAPDKTHSTVTGLWVDPSDVIRPAYQSDAARGDMFASFPEGQELDAQFKSWFDQNILDSYYYGSYPWTRLGYTYDWANNGKVYGLTEFLVKKGAQAEVAFTETTDEFLQRLYSGAE